MLGLDVDICICIHYSVTSVQDRYSYLARLYKVKSLKEQTRRLGDVVVRATDDKATPSSDAARNISCQAGHVIYCLPSEPDHVRF